MGCHRSDHRHQPDKRTDRLSQIQQELAQLNVPTEKITRLAACEETNGQLGRRHSHLQALQIAQQKGWKNYLLLEDDCVILKQEKHTRVLSTLLGTLTKLPREVIILGGQIKQGSVLKAGKGWFMPGTARKFARIWLTVNIMPRWRNRCQMIFLLRPKNNGSRCCIQEMVSLLPKHLLSAGRVQ